MKSCRLAREGFSSLGKNKLRSFFMMAGTMVGVAAVTVIMALGKGSQQKVRARVDRFLTPSTIALMAGRDPGPPDMSVTTLTLADAEAVKQLSGLESVSVSVWDFAANLKCEDRTTVSLLWGVEPIWHPSMRWPVASGEGITASDLASLERVCVLGTTTRKKLFGDQDPLGQKIYINKVPVTVKGVLEPRGASPHGKDFDETILVPLTTALRRILNVDHVTSIRVLCQDPSALADRARAITALMRERHHITPPADNDFHLNTATVIAGQVMKMGDTLLYFLVALAAISLVVGGFVLSNIMLISVSERTREIGLRRAVGATTRDIFRQFLLEAWIVSLLGMATGSLLGGAICLLLARFARMPLAFSPLSLALALFFAFVVGTLSGLSPARRAARLHPVDALRG